MPSRGVDVMGHHVQQSDWRRCRNVGQNLAAGDAPRLKSREAGNSCFSSAQVELAMKQYEVNSDVVEQDIDRAIKLAGGLTTTGIPGAITDARSQPRLPMIFAELSWACRQGFDKLARCVADGKSRTSFRQPKLLQSVVGSLNRRQNARRRSCSTCQAFEKDHLAISRPEATSL